MSGKGAAAITMTHTNANVLVVSALNVKTLLQVGMLTRMGDTGKGAYAVREPTTVYPRVCLGVHVINPVGNRASCSLHFTYLRLLPCLSSG